jgi:hypothetical protein
MADTDVIRRIPHEDRDPHVHSIARMKRALMVGNPPHALKLISQFRHDNPDFEFDTELNCVKLLIQDNHINEAQARLDTMRTTLFSPFMARGLLTNRLRRGGNTGTLDQIPNDIMDQIMPRHK